MTYALTTRNGVLLRLRLVFRFNCLRLFVAVTILICSSYQLRARMLDQWIRVAMEMRASLGNLYGFAYVMEGLQCPQVSRWVLG